MVMPLAGRVPAAVAGGLLVLVAVYSVTATLIVSRPVNSRLTRWVDQIVDWAYQQVAGRFADPQRRDRIRATQAAAVLLGQLTAWLLVAYAGFALLLWPFASRGVVSAFIDAGSSLFTLGFAVPAGAVPAVIVFLAAATGLVILTLQIAYLPTLYAAFNRRETQVALLNERAGMPSWGPELLARTYYALGTGVSTLDTLPDLYARWENWAADVAESHTTYPVLIRFRSPGPLSSWVISLLAVLDSAALFLALSPKSRAGGPGPAVPARRVQVLQPDRPGDGLRHPRRARPGRRDQPDVRPVPRGGGPDARGRLPDRARPCRGLAGFRRMAGQLRASCLRGGRRGLRRAGAVVRPAPAPDVADPAKTSRTRPPTKVINGVPRGRRLAGRGLSPAAIPVRYREGSASIGLVLSAGVEWKALALDNEVTP